MPPKKKLTKQPKNTAERVGNTLTPQFPSKGGNCNHSKVGCFKVVLEGRKVTGSDTFHYFDEGGAVLFAMQQSRSLGITATVTSPDGGVVCVFRKRTYDVDAWVKEFTEYNERMHIGSDKYDQRNKAAAAKRRADIQKSLSKTTPKKKVLKRR